MKKRIIGLIFAAALTAPAHAEMIDLKCQRYESKCSAGACYHLSEALKDDKDRQIFAIQKTEEVVYHVGEDKATVTLENEIPNAILQGGKYVLPYKHVTWEDGVVILENRTASGMVRERVEIDPDFGFYAHYMMHTDGSIHDVPLGEPYTAYFGWCVDTTAKKTVPEEAKAEKDERSWPSEPRRKLTPAPRP